MFESFFKFDTFLSTKLITAVHAIVQVLVLLIYVTAALGAVSNHKFDVAAMSVIFYPLSVIGVRVFFEGMIVVFRIYEALVELKNK
jgi:hypothetical protein